MTQKTKYSLQGIIPQQKIAQSELLISLLQSHTKSFQNKISARACSNQIKEYINLHLAVQQLNECKPK